MNIQKEQNAPTDQPRTTENTPVVIKERWTPENQPVAPIKATTPDERPPFKPAEEPKPKVLKPAKMTEAQVLAKLAEVVSHGDPATLFSKQKKIGQG